MAKSTMFRSRAKATPRTGGRVVSDDVGRAVYGVKRFNAAKAAGRTLSGKSRKRK